MTKNKGLRVMNPKTFFSTVLLFTISKRRQKQESKETYIIQKSKIHQRDDLADSMTQDLGPSYERFRFFGLWLGGTPLSTKPLEGLYS